MRTLHVGLRVSDLERSLALCASPDGSEDFWTAWISDPDGNRIELVLWPAGHSEGMTEADFADHAARD